MSKPVLRSLLALAVVQAAALAPVGAQTPAATPPELVAAYDSLASTLLAAQQTEWHMVHSILSVTYSHAEATLAAARGKVAAGKDSRAEIERLATLVSQIGNEGDASVAAVRKRLVEGGHHHHHHASAEQQGEYDQGFVIVTRAAKKAFLDASKEIGKLAASPTLPALDAAWQRVEQQFKALHKDGAAH